MLVRPRLSSFRIRPFGKINLIEMTPLSSSCSGGGAGYCPRVCPQSAQSFSAIVLRHSHRNITSRTFLTKKVAAEEVKPTATLRVCPYNNGSAPNYGTICLGAADSFQCADARTDPPPKRGQMPVDDAAKFRKQADESREQAAKAVNPLDKEAWLRIAEEWLKLAISVEGRRQG